MPVLWSLVCAAILRVLAHEQSPSATDHGVGATRAALGTDLASCSGCCTMFFILSKLLTFKAERVPH